MNLLIEFRQEIDRFMKLHPHSPLEDEARATFESLNYFDPDEDMVFEVEVERFAEDEPVVTMQTSTGATQDYRRWGKFDFDVGGQQASLIIYSDPGGHDFFMPFKDKTNGRETYGAGRYMDDHRPGIRRIEGDRFEKDFNFAYNPYCAYSAHFSCPLPPVENWLKVPIKAGEKDFKK